MQSGKIERREILKGLGFGALVIALPGWQGRQGRSASETESGGAVIGIETNYTRSQWYFEPTGLFIQKGQKVRWTTSTKWGGRVSAFHPSNFNHELRIPENAKPFDSGLIGQTYQNTFEWTFDVEGTYDYFCLNHEILGMVGRIVVGHPGGPAETNPPGYGAREGRAPLFPTEIQVFEACPSQEIVAKKHVPFPAKLVGRSFPYGDVR